MSPPQWSTGHKGFCNNANTVQGGKGWGERGERGKPNDFNTNNLQGAFCKQRGGHHARSTCLSALTLIVRGRRKNRGKKKKKEKTGLPIPCVHAGRGSHALPQPFPMKAEKEETWGQDRAHGCWNKDSPASQTCRHLLCLPPDCFLEDAQTFQSSLVVVASWCFTSLCNPTMVFSLCTQDKPRCSAARLPPLVPSPLGASLFLFPGWVWSSWKAPAPTQVVEED